MFWGRGNKDLSDPGEAARRDHSRWLTEALLMARAYPRIPVRRVDSGGFSRLMSLKSGPAHAEKWWNLALARIPDDEID